jgi:hypothetical protein
MHPLVKRGLIYSTLHLAWVFMEYMHYRWCVKWYMGFMGHTNITCAAIRKSSNAVSALFSNKFTLGIDLLVAWVSRT